MAKKMLYYLITIKGHAYRHYTKDELDREWELVRKRMTGAEWSDCRAYESDSRGRMHLHVYCKVGRKPFFPRFQKVGWSVHFQEFPVEDIDRVYDYLNKHKQTPNLLDETFLVNRSSHEYLFIDPI